MQKLRKKLRGVVVAGAGWVEAIAWVGGVGARSWKAGCDASASDSDP